MKRPIFVLVMSGVAGAVVAAILMACAFLVVQNRALSRELAGARENGRSAAARSVELQQQMAATRSTEEQMRLRADKLDAELAALRAVAVSNNAPGRALRSPVFLNGEQIGEAWVLPARDGQAGKAGAGPAVVLDASTKSRLPRAASEVAAGVPVPVPVPATVNNSYVEQNGGWWPVYWGNGGHGISQPPTDGGLPKPPTPSAGPAIRKDGGIWRPTGKPFLPSGSTWPIVTPPQSAAPRLPVAGPGPVRGVGMPAPAAVPFSGR